MRSQAAPNGQAKSRKARIVAVVTVAAVIVAGLLIASQVIPFPRKNATPNVVDRTLLDGTITVEAGSYWYLQFIMPHNSMEIKVSGSFSVLGGSENEVRIYIMNETTFQHSADFESGSFYDSRRLNNATITATLPSEGTYYLMFDNVFSNSQKNVNIQAKTDYYQFPS